MVAYRRISARIRWSRQRTVGVLGALGSANVAATNKYLRPVIAPATRPVDAAGTADLFGFWLAWHLGGFERLRRLGMRRSAIYRRIKWLRQIRGQHPDEYEIPGVGIDLAAYQGAGGVPVAGTS